MNPGSFQKGTFFKPNVIALIGDYIPRKCGIATFTSDLLRSLQTESPESEFCAVVMNDIPEGYDYPAEVRFEVNQNRVQEYHLAGDFLNINRVDVVCLQHEYGIFGGKQGSHILSLLRNLRMPLVTTFHTVLKDPLPDQKVVLEELGRLSDRVVVMSRLAVQMLKEIYNFPEHKIIYIPHGIPDVPFIDPNYYKDQFGVEGKNVILTFGLLSPGKGIEYMIHALPEVLEKHPDTVYVILGATHPNIKRETGEEYRISLQQLSRKLGIEKHLIFHNRFVSLKELCEFLGCADIYVTPYLNKNQIVSGTLAYAMGTGKAVVSTPYYYAEEMLADGRGKLVTFADHSALAREIIYLLDNPVEMNAMRKKAYLFCRNMVWREVARQYLEVFAHLKEERQRCPRVVFQKKGLDALPRELPEIKLDYLRFLTDDTGILQHARFTVPNRYHGYTTDDNARGLIAVLTAQDILLEDEVLETMAGKYLSFLGYAFNDNSGRFHNFMTYHRTWMEEIGSEDSHGRALWGLGTAVALSKQEGQVAMATSLFERALSACEELGSFRAWAFALMGIIAYRKRFCGDSNARRIGRELSERMYRLYRENGDRQWPWPEDCLTYANGKIPHALILTGKEMEREDILKAGLKMLDWLCKIQKDPAGHFVPVGNSGWYRKNGFRARFDQQPIEAEAMIGALCAAYEVTGDDRWIDEANRCFDWFMGKNDHQVPIYDYNTGGCRDGLTAEGVNQNEGAESTLAWLLSLITMYHLRETRAISIAGKNEQKKEVYRKGKRNVTHTKLVR